MVENSFSESPLERMQSEKYENIFLDQKEGKYPVVNGTYILGDLRSSVAVLLPTPDRSLEMMAIAHGAALAGSVNTSSLGLESIIANIISNPNIRNIIVFGQDGPSFHPGQSLINLKEFGVDDKGFILKTDDKWGARILHLDKKMIGQFQQQIENVVDLLGQDDSSLLASTIDACIQEPENAQRLTTKKGKQYILYDPGPLNHSPLYAPITIGAPGGIIDKVFDPFSSLIIAEDISQAYSLLWSNVRAQGRKVQSQFGPTVELLNCVIQIRKPLTNYLALAGDKEKQADGQIISNYMYEDYPLTKSQLEDFLEKYFKTLMSAEKVKIYLDKSTGDYKVKENSEAKYTYGERIRGYPYRDNNGRIRTRDNLQMVIQALTNAIKFSANTRRCMISLIDPVYDLTIDLQDVDPPCIITLNFNPRSSDKFNWTIYGTMVMRSHDVRRAFVSNSFAFAKLTEYICNEVSKTINDPAYSVKMGPITMFLISAHEYL